MIIRKKKWIILGIKLKTMVIDFFRIDFNTKYIIRLIKLNDSLELHQEELKWRISQLNEFQFFYVLNEVILDIEITKENLDIFFSFIDIDDFPFPCVTYLDYNHDTNMSDTIFNNLKENIEKKIINLLCFETEWNKNFWTLISEIKSKLEDLDSDVNICAVYGLPNNVVESVGDISRVDFIKKQLEIILYDQNYDYKDS